MHPPTPNGPLATTSRPVRVLYVGDEPESADRTTRIERHDDIDTVVTEPTASEALRRLDDTVDCVVSDHELSDTDGLAFLEAVRETRPELPFISFADGESEEFVREAIAAGVTDYVRKPDGADQYTVLSHRISKAVREARTERTKRAHHQYRRLIEESSDVIAVLDEQGRFTYLSPAAERRLGYPAAELVGDTVFQYVHPDDEAAVQDRFAALMDHPERRVSTEFRFEQRDGSRIWLEADGRNLLEDPTIEGLVLYVRDITDRKEREQELEAMKDRVELALESRDAVLWEWYPDSDTAAVIYPSAASLFGRDIESYEAFAKLIHPDDRPRVDESIESALESETSYSFDCRIELDGEIRWLGTMGRVVRDEQGDPARVVGVSTDITERRRREQDLREVTEEYEAVFDNAEDAIFLLDVEHAESGVEFRFERLGPSLEAISGLTTGEIRGKTPREALGRDLGAEVEANYRRCVEAREPITYEEELPMPEDRVIWHTSLAPVIVDGDVTRIVGIARDVTARKRREARLVGQNELARACLEADTRQQIGDLVVDRAEEPLGMPVALVARYDDENNTLEPTAATSTAEFALDIAALVTPEGPGWRTFAENEPRRLTEIEDVIVTDCGPVGIWPLGRHGVFAASMDEEDGETADAFGATVAATMQTALDSVEHLQDLEEREAQLTDLTDTLERLNRVNDVIRQVDQALVNASTRSAVEEAVCEELAQFEPYVCAVMSGYDQLEETVVASEWAGNEQDYLNAVSLDTGPWAVAAETRDPQVVQEFLSDPPLEPWQEAAIAREFRSCLALPVTYGDSLYGVLTVFGDRPGLFDEMEREVLGELATNIAHAVNAVESKQALVSDRVVELEFETRSEEVPFVALVTETGGRFEFQSVVPEADGRLKNLLHHPRGSSRRRPGVSATD